MLNVAMLSPLPASPDSPPESGVAHYTASLVQSLRQPVTIIAQKGAFFNASGSVVVEKVWEPNLKAPFQIQRAIRRIAPDVLHVQHEFNLYGGLLQGALLTLMLGSLRKRGTRIITTIHGVVGPGDVSSGFLDRNHLAPSTLFVRRAFGAFYGRIDAASDALIVHHEYFKHVLVDAYGIKPEKVFVVPHGTTAGPESVRANRERTLPNILCLGFLTGYKRPELLVEVARAHAIPSARYTFCVGANPRLKDHTYLARYRDLEASVHALGPIAAWRGYIPDEALDPTLESADAIVLPYTECVAVSGISALANQWRVPICYSQPLRPLFGPGPLEFSLDPQSLALAIRAALLVTDWGSIPGFATWYEVALATQEVWRRVSANA